MVMHARALGGHGLELFDPARGQRDVHLGARAAARQGKTQARADADNQGNLVRFHGGLLRVQGCTHVTPEAGAPDRRRHWLGVALEIRAALDQAANDDIGLALNQSQPLGSERFYAKIERITGQRREARPRGWPRMVSAGPNDGAVQQQQRCC